MTKNHYKTQSVEPIFYYLSSFYNNSHTGEVQEISVLGNRERETGNSQRNAILCFLNP